VCWSTATGPTISNTKTSDGTGSGIFVSNITGLTASTTYYVRAYATNSIGTAYGNNISFTTLSSSAFLTTTAASGITQTTAVSGGTITSNGGAVITVSGICWSLIANPTTADAKTTDGTNSGSFSSSLTGLSAGTTYHVRAYATNSIGTAYGNDVSFTTLTTTATLMTTAVSTITQTTAVSGGTITSNGGSVITVSGICWGLTASPTTADSKTTDGTTTGTFSSNLTGLIAGTIYHVRAYATNGAGTVYGNDVSFTTYPIVLATIATTSVTSITQNTAVSGGNISVDGGGAITAKGVCWATSAAPTIINSKTSDGTGNGSFTSNLIGLLSGITYHARAYGTNSAGTAYGNEVSFTTLPAVITVTDIDGNVYNTVNIGTQVWMKENLKTTKYNDGSSIPNVTDNATWSGLSSPAFCWYNNDATNYKATFGALYNWYAVDVATVERMSVPRIGMFQAISNGLHLQLIWEVKVLLGAN
jgi:hypothetical protein